MSNANIEVVAVTPTAIQQRALRSLALASSKKSATELANDLFSQVVRGRFKAMVEANIKTIGEKYDRAVSMGFKIDMSREDYIKKSRAEYAEILTQL